MNLKAFDFLVINEINYFFISSKSVSFFLFNFILKTFFFI